MLFLFPRYSTGKLTATGFSVQIVNISACREENLDLVDLDIPRRRCERNVIPSSDRRRLAVTSRRTKLTIVYARVFRDKSPENSVGLWKTP